MEALLSDLDLDQSLTKFKKVNLRCLAIHRLSPLQLGYQIIFIEMNYGLVISIEILYILHTIPQ